MNDSEKLWLCFEDQLARRVPMLLSSLGKPAALTEIAETENELGLIFPHQLRFAYARHNGCCGAQDCPSFFVPGGADWLTLAQLREHWRVHRDIVNAENNESGAVKLRAVAQLGKVRNEFWNEKRIPVGRAWGGLHLFIDLWPGPSGLDGQLVLDDGLGEFADERVVATCFDAYLGELANRLDQGLIEYEQGKSWINARTRETVLDWDTLSGW